MQWSPPKSLWTPRRKREWRKSPLDYLCDQTFWIPLSANMGGRLVPPRTHYRVWQPPLAPKNAELVVGAPSSAQPAGSPAIDYPLALPIYIDSSMLTAWRACHSKHLFGTLYGLYPTGKSVHLIAGAATAAGCEAARKRFFAQPTSSNYELLQAAYIAFNREWGDYDPPDSPYLQKTFENSFTALAAYLEEYPPGTDSVQPMVRADGSPAVEYTFAVELPILHPSGDPFLFVGRFDMLGIMNGYLPVVLDEKTTSAFSSSWAESWDMRGQFLGYCWALQQQGLEVRDVVVRGIGIFKTKTENKTAYITYPQFLIDRWYTQMLRDVQDIVNSYRLLTRDEPTTVYSKNFGDSCDSYGGCAFKTLCTAHNPLDYFSNYLKHRWNPLAKQPVEELENA